MTTQKHSVLIVEDESIVAKDLQQALTGMGYDAYAIASSADQALLHATVRCPDIVIMDIVIKGTLDGIDTAAVLRQRFGVPVVYLTAYTDEATIERAKKTEPYGFLVKPMKLAELRSTLEIALYRHASKKGTNPSAHTVATPSDAERRGRRTSVLVADDHEIVREGLVALLKEHFEVVAAVGDGDALLDSARRLRPDVIVTDMSMPGLSGLDVLAHLKTEGLDVKVIILTMHSDADLATRAARAGASGFLVKHSAGDELVSAIHRVMQGHTYMTPVLTRGVLERLAAPVDESEPQLTPRQSEVLRLIVEGRRMKEIATALDLSTRTVETHKYELMRVLNVQSTAELVRYAIVHRLIAD